MSKYKVTFLPDEKEVEVEGGTTLLQAAEKAGIYINSLCGGEGLCGECRLQIVSGNAKPDKHTIGFLSKDEIQDGYVLACQTKVEDNLEVMIPAKSRLEEERIITEGARLTYSEPEKIVLYKRPYDPASFFEPLVSKVYLELPEPTLEDNASDIDRIVRELRKKSRYSYFEIPLACLQNLAAKLRARMVFACGRGSLHPLHQAVVANINNLTQALAQEKGIDIQDIAAIVAAGNTTMSHFLLNLIPCSIRLDPYVPTATIYPQILAREIGININPQGILEVIPSVASYVGGDIVAGVLACGLADKPEIKCLIDVGTNGEIAIGNNEWIVCCSASAGPAFEGGGTRSGMRATKGAIEKLEITNGQVTYETIGRAKPRGICGSGLIDAIHELVRNNIIGPDGKFDLSRNDKRILEEENEPNYILAFPEETETGQAITISESEIANLIKSKGAVFAAIKSLTDYVGLTFEQLDTIYVAGGFGSSLNIPKAIAIGLLPDIDTQRIQFIGNSSVMGARMALLSAPAFEKTIDIAKKMTNIELSSYPPFMNEFVAALFLPHTERSLFPSVHY